MRRQSQKGTVILVALSCVTVLGIVLASFLAVSNQAMKLSNRNYAKDVSKQLAEMGLERALRSFNYDTFGSWTHPDATTATQTVAVSSSHYGNSGITAAINIRVNHYRDTNKTAIWSGLTNYAANDFVWYQGVWYLCTSAPPSNQAPTNTAFWTSAPEAWSPYANYQVGNLALSGGTVYRCIAANLNQVPPNATYWTGSSAAAWNASTAYGVNDVALSGGTPYRCIAAHSNHVPPNSAYWLGAPVIYAEGVATLPDSTATTIKTQLHATIAPAPLFPNAVGATTLVNLAASGTLDSYNSVLGTYNQTTAPFSAGSPNIGSSAVLAGGNTSGTAVNVTSARVAGYVTAPSASTSPYAPRWSFGGTAIVTATTSGTPGTKIDLTRVSRSPYVPQFDVQSVSGAASLPSGSTILPDGANSLGTAGAAAPSIYNVTGTYDNGTSTLYSGLYLPDGADILTINGPVILNVTGTLYTYYGRIVISPTGSLEIYFTGQLWVGSGATSGIQNQTLDPRKCILVGTSSANTSSSHYYWSTDPFYGTIYMPNAYVSTWNNVTIHGAISAKKRRFPQRGRNTPLRHLPSHRGKSRHFYRRSV